LGDIEADAGNTAPRSSATHRKQIAKKRYPLILPLNIFSPKYSCFYITSKYLKKSMENSEIPPASPGEMHQAAVEKK
jgi:hypothetical protein